tara:strand:- start:1599 stop:3713 length:2115 start_codon:yes stop_codon:yes gene_type:complete
MKISILLPYKENFSPEYAGAVSLSVNDINNKSIYKKNIVIFGNTLYKNYLSKSYKNVPLSKKIFQSKSKAYVNSFINLQKKNIPSLIEIHNRPNYIKIISANLSAKLHLFFHNDPLEMSGSKTLEERIFLLDKLDHIIFNSIWCKNRFFIGLNKKKYTNKTSVTYQSSSKVKIDFKNKKRIISFVGKLNKAKGYDVFAIAIKKILDKYKNWNAVVFGDEPREQITLKHKRVKIFGFKKNSYILKYLEKISISTICSRWEEPFGRASLEAASRGSAVIITNRGGLPETTKHALILKKLNVNTLFNKIEFLIKNDALRSEIQKLSYKDFKFTHSYIAREIDKRRSATHKNNNIHKPVSNIKILKILHVTNFNERHDGRLHYNTGKRINNGFVRLGHNVLQLSDRDISSNYRTFLDPKGIDALNLKIINSYNKFKPNLIVLGHADNVLVSTLDFLKNLDKNLKICQWFLDPVSNFAPDFEKNKKRILDKANTVDANFLTTDPSALSFKINKAFFIPNPSDQSFEVLENYKQDCENDMFFAMSHGVHRGNLKYGKSDIREHIIKKLIDKNQKIKFDTYGVNGVQPIWGDEFIRKLSLSKMGLNLSRGKPIKYYSSDRLSQLMGNGLLTFIDEKTEYSNFFNKDELITYSGLSDLSEKINKYKRDDNQRRIIARNGKNKYMKFFNSSLVAKFIINKTLQINKKKFYWDK